MLPEDTAQPSPVPLHPRLLDGLDLDALDEVAALWLTGRPGEPFPGESTAEALGRLLTCAVPADEVRAVCPTDVFEGRMLAVLLLVTSSGLVFLIRPWTSPEWVMGPVIPSADVLATEVTHVGRGDVALLLQPRQELTWDVLGTTTTTGGQCILRLRISEPGTRGECAQIGVQLVDAIRSVMPKRIDRLGGLAATESWIGEAIRGYPVPTPIDALTADPVPREQLTKLENEPWPDRLWADLQKAWTGEGQALADELAERYGWFWDQFAVKALAARLPTLHTELTTILRNAAPALLPHDAGPPRESFVIHLLDQAVFRLASSCGGVVEARHHECPVCGASFRDSELSFATVRQLPGLRYCYGCSIRALIAPSRYHRPYDGLEESSAGSRTREERTAAMHRLVDELGAIPDLRFVDGGSGFRRLTALPVDLHRRDRIVAALAAVPDVEELYADYGRPWTAVLRGLGLIGDTWRPARGTHCQAEDGQWVRSLAEKTIDDFFTAHGIEHEHEPAWPAHPQLNPRGRMRADWRLPDGTMVEYAGMLEDPSYVAKIQAKRQLAEEVGLDLLVLTPVDLYSLPAHFEVTETSTADRGPVRRIEPRAPRPDNGAIQFGIDGQAYEIELDPSEEREFRRLIGRYVAAGRRSRRQ